MPTNRQMEARDELEARRNRIKLIREGILEPVEGKALSLSAPRVWGKNWGEVAKGRRQAPDYHIPAARPIRPTSPSGATSFHFGHASVSKVTRFTVVEGMRNQPGAAKKHGRYLERESAVAHIGRGEGSEPQFVREPVPEKFGEQPGAAPDLLNATPGEQRADSGSAAAGQDRYLIRDAALAIQPDGSRALVTNISQDDDERAEFWDLLEQHEGTPNPDTMSFRASDNTEFWDAVLRNPDCPADLRDKLEGSDKDSPEPFVVDSARRIIAFLGEQPGWITPAAAAKRKREGLGPNMADFVIGRGGRVQYRINAALPAELSPEQNLAVLCDFSKEFEKRGMPHVAVMHAPDEHNDEANWHFHLAYTDRPARRIDEADIKQLARKGFDVSTLKPGMWDFAVELSDPKKPTRKKRPLRRKKVPEVSRSQNWPKTLRVALATIVNRHLEAAGVARQVSPETYKEMGLDITPQEHLGTRQNALETKGKATASGIANEQKQWAWIQAQAKARHDAEVADADVRIERLLHSQSASAARDKRIAELRETLYRAARLRHDAFIIDQEIERAKSRAVMVRERNLRMLEAARSDPHKARPAKVKEWQDLVASATRYLAATEDKLAPDALAVSRWQREALQCEERARVIQAAFDRPVETGQAAGKSSPTPARSDPAHSETASRLSISPALLANVAAARERQRLQREADEKFMEEWLRRQREKEAAAKSQAPEDRANGGQQRRAVKPRPIQLPPPEFDLGR